MRNSFRFFVLGLIVAGLTACGGGGGSDSDESTLPPDDSSDQNQTPPDTTPDPNPTPSEDSPEAYTAAIERMVGALLLVEKAGRSGVHKIPELVADQVTAHGPSKECGIESACDPDYHEPEYFVYLPTGEVVTVTDWQDINKNLVFDPTGEILRFSVTEVYGITAWVQVRHGYENDPDVYDFVLMPRHDDNVSLGARIGTTESMLYNGFLAVRELSDGRLRIGDYDARPPSEFRNIVLYDLQHNVALDTVFTMETNASDSDAVYANFDWIENGMIDPEGYAESFQTLSMLDFGEVSGKIVLEAGSFLYTRNNPDGTDVSVRVSVDADPGLLRFEIDLGADGQYDAEGFVPQDELNFILP